MTDPVELIYERVLVVRCQAGDAAAFEEIVARYQPRLRYFLRKLLGSAEQAEDALQDVWLDVFRHLPRLSAPEAFRAWLYRVARDRAFGMLRKERRITQPLPETGPVDPACDEADEFTAEDAAQVHAALDRLAPEQREVLVLRFLEAMSYEEIARVTGQPLGTVRSRIHYSKSALKRALEKEPVR